MRVGMSPIVSIHAVAIASDRLTSILRLAISSRHPGSRQPHQQGQQSPETPAACGLSPAVAVRSDDDSALVLSLPPGPLRGRMWGTSSTSFREAAPVIGAVSLCWSGTYKGRGWMFPLCSLSVHFPCWQHFLTAFSRLRVVILAASSPLRLSKPDTPAQSGQPTSPTQRQGQTRSTTASLSAIDARPLPFTGQS